MIIVSLKVSAPTKVEETDKDIEELMNGVSSTDSEVSANFSNSEVFSLTDPVEIINKNTIVISEQSTENRQKIYQPIERTDPMMSARMRHLSRIAV